MNRFSFFDSNGQFFPNQKKPGLVCCILPLFLFGVSCSEKVKKDIPPVAGKQTLKPPVIKKPASSFQDTVIIKGKAAVFYNPDSAQLEKIKKVNQKEIYAMIAHDCHYQMQNARLSIQNDWPNVHILDISKARWLLFVKDDKSKIYVDLNGKNDICGMFIFDGRKDPIMVDMPNVDTILGFYFRQ